ncbi:mannonate dehydratase [bacterium]|nr:mannonate dehydratase [bacterium]
MKEISGRPILNDREYESEEIWENFQYFLDRTLPVAEEFGVCMALHPNDPPQPQRDEEPLVRHD